MTTLDHSPAPVLAPRPDSLEQKRFRRYLLGLSGTTAALLAAGGLALAAAGLLRWAPLVLLVAFPLAVRIADGLSRMCLMTLLRAVPEPPHLAGPKLAPAMAATAVVYPAIVDGQADVDALVECVRANRDVTGRGPAMHLALVDLADSPHEHDPGDAALAAAIRAGLAGLGPGPAPVAVLFRRRLWNPREGHWMAWERKRGKLEEFVALIDGRTDTTFAVDTAEDRAVVERLGAVRYVLTIDLGDRLQPRAARRLVATVAHPDNAAVVDPARGIVVSGFGIARPINVPARPSTWFEWATYPYRIPEGIPSARQAAFGSDEFYGQGVLDTHAYRAVLAGRIPPDSVLSHDRLEGLHLRAAAVTDARLVEAHVGDYLFFRAREHRWVRGDTHVLPWILGRRGLTRLPGAERLCMARDLLSHLYSAALTALFALAWLAAPAGQSGWWTLALLALSAHPIVFTSLMPQLLAVRGVLTGPGEHSVRRIAGAWRRGLRPSGRLAVAETARWLIALAVLADMALVALDAVIRASYRTTVSHRRVLQWTSATRAGRVAPGLGTRLRRLWPASTLALGLGLVAGWLDPVRLRWAGPLLVLWLAIPVLAYRLSQPAPRLPDVSMT
ncbi:hypothetical protein [Dactylosporangium sp. CA-233914]|uniref:hypothetical protein n=1 Tax=Dactylosporangium sp. CA-233914 TaxID=3239934 RepID=UPI003D93A440